MDFDVFICICGLVYNVVVVKVFVIFLLQELGFGNGYVFQEIVEGDELCEIGEKKVEVDQVFCSGYGDE